MAKLKLTANQIATLSLALAVASSVFAVYQWWTSDKQEKIRAAIDISNQHLADPVNKVALDLLARQVQSGQGSIVDFAPKLASYRARLEYFAFLANRGLADRRYYSMSLTCDIIGIASSDPKEDPPTNPQATEFSRREKIACP
jgi:hypothetical protein